MKAILGAVVLSTIVCAGQGTISTYATPGTTGANGIAFDAQGNLYYSWTAEAKIIKVSPSGTSTTIAGNGSFGFAGDGGPAAALAYLSPVAASGTSFGSFSVQAIAAPGKFTANLVNGGTTDIGMFGANLGYSKNLNVQ